MSGHSKWATIHRDKEINDQKRGQAFTKIANMITLAVKESGGVVDSAANFKLRLAVEKARSINMPNDKIQKAMDRGLGKAGEGDLAEVIYEGYAPGGVGMLVETLTDNKQRTVQEIKNIFDRAGGSIASPGSVAFNFKKVGAFVIEVDQNDKDETSLQLIDLGVEDIDEDSGCIVAYVPVERLEELKTILTQAGMKIRSAEMVQIPTNDIEITDAKIAGQLVALIDKLDALDDVQKVYSNFHVPDELVV